ncbi:Adenosine kinase [uncultured delta proteobacterium]|uniref:Adenosine kinase n=1 Tax=uncultured delta proteobacterium TaxID=34034 RepID=A0A212KF97_9DELT|nr:Adenosine kinase [uncultured delta proteobacterium]
MTLYINGSMAYDRIMNFPGSFSDSILPDKIHIMNVSFMIERLDEKLGGCAGNIAYSLAVLGEKPVIVSRVGRDFARYKESLESLGLPLDGITPLEDELTAGAYIITDRNNNQITAFNPGAMRHPAPYSFEKAGPGDIMIVSPGNLEDMRRIPKLCREKGARCIYDPGQQLPVLTGEDLINAINGSYMLICNDYEFELICQKSGKTPEDLLAMAENIIVTLGENGSRVQCGGKTELVPAVAPKRIADPTGAGDAYRSGLLKGLSLGLSVLESARIGSTTASFCVEAHGTQAPFTAEECRNRHRNAFGVSF